MDVCVPASTAIYSLGLFFGLLSVVDIVRRNVPSIIIKFRVLLTLFFLVSVSWIANYNNSSSVADGVVALIRMALIWPLCLYFLENFVNIFLGLEFKSARDLSKLMTCWQFARIGLATSYITLAIAFPFEPTSRLSIASKIVLLICLVSVILPVAITLLKLALALRRHLVILGSPTEDTPEVTPQEEPPALAPTRKRIKAVAVQVSSYGTFLLAICAYAIITETKNVVELASNPPVDAEKPNCSYIVAALYVVPGLITLLMTRSPSSSLRNRHNASNTKGTPITSQQSGRPRSNTFTATTSLVGADQPGNHERRISAASACQQPV